MYVPSKRILIGAIGLAAGVLWATHNALLGLICGIVLFTSGALLTTRRVHEKANRR